jgi:hypothetical protein
MVHYRAYIAAVGGEMSHYPMARAESGEGPNASGWFRRARGDTAIFCAMVLLAAAMVVGATAARRPSLVTVSIAGTVDLLTDPGVQRELRALGYNVETNGLGADQILAQVPLRGYQVAYVPNQVVGTAIEQKLSNLNLQSDAVVPARSRLVVATYQQLLPLLREAGIARREHGVWMFDINAYVTDVIKRGGPLRWENLPGYRNDAEFPSPGPILLYTTDPRYSVLTDMFIAVAGYRLNGNSEVTDQAEVNSVVARLKPCFSQQGSMPTGGIPEWNDFLEGDINTDPMALTYESLYVSLEEAHNPSITKNMVMMYVSPEMDVQETLIPLDNTGTAVSDELATDPRIQQIAEEKLGFITTSPDDFQQDMAKAGITVAGELQTVNPPAYNILQDIVNGLP